MISSQFLTNLPLLEKPPLLVCVLAAGWFGAHAVQWILDKNEKKIAVIEVKKEEALLAASALIFQKIYRGHLARRKVNQLKKSVISLSLLKKALPYLRDPNLLKALPRASSGKTPVYLPREPIVLKKSGRLLNQERFVRMAQAREICDKNNYTHLVIPKARVCKEFIVEERLPITYTAHKEQMGLYAHNQGLFTKAVEEFTGFLFQSTLSDVAGNTKGAYGYLNKEPLGRYDNVCLHLEGGVGRIGLVDLERFSPEVNKIEPTWSFERCQVAISLFPYHVEAIINVAKKFDPSIQTYRHMVLRRTERRTLDFFKRVYWDHLEFIREKGITATSPVACQSLSREETEKFKSSLQEKLVKLNEEKGMYSNRSKIYPQVTLDSFFSKHFSTFLKQLYKLMNSYLASQRLKQEEKGNLTVTGILNSRTLCFNFNECEMFKKGVMPLLGMDDQNKADLDACFLLVDLAFEELVALEKIAFYSNYAEKNMFLMV